MSSGRQHAHVTLVSLLALAFPSSVSFAMAPDVAQESAATEAAINKDLQNELLAMQVEDQRYRQEIHAFMKEGKPVPAELWEKQGAIDQKNMKRLEEIIEKHGWPGKSLVGEEAAGTAFLILQHSESKTLERYLPLLKEAAAKGEANPADAAMAEDRVLMNQGKKQIYGTQIKNKELYPIEDEANVDARRAAVGLPPLAEYLKFFGLEYKPPKKD